MTTDPTIRDQTYHYFLQEASELLQALEQELLSLREDYSINKVYTLMRIAHTLKGAAATVGLETIKSVTHSLEDIFKAICQPGLSIDPELEALLFEGYECLRLPITAVLAGKPVNDTDVLDRTATVFAQLQEKLGDCFGQEAYLPSSQELGFDLTQSIFELGVAEGLDHLAATLASGDPEEIATTLRSQAEVFQGLGESLMLPGFGAIAKAAIAALDAHPKQVVTVAQIALDNFQEAQTAVLNGDRSQGGQLSQVLQQLSGLPTSAAFAPVEEVVSQGKTGTTGNRQRAKTGEAGKKRQTTTTGNRQRAKTGEVGKRQTTTTGNRQRAKTGEAGKRQTTTTGNRQRAKNPDLPISPSPQDAIEAQESVTQFELGSVTSVVNLENEESANPLLESIWGGAGEIESKKDGKQEQEKTGMWGHGDGGNVSQKLFASSKDEPEEVKVKMPSTPMPETGHPTPILNKDQVSGSRSVRVNLEHLEHLNYSIGELLTNQNRQSLQNDQLQAAVRVLLFRLQQHQQLLYQLKDKSNPMLSKSDWELGRFFSQSPVSERTDAFDSLELNRYTENDSVLQSIIEEAVQLAEAIDTIDLFTRQSHETLEKQRRLLTSTREALMAARMSTLGDIFDRFPLVLRQLEITHKKQVALELRGNEVLVDKVVVEKLSDPLLHLVRNAFDHGIESPAVRQQRGKPEKGQIEICAYHQGRYLMIEVHDDGQGLDFEKIRACAVERQFVSPEQASGLTEADLSDLLFEPSFSTSSDVNDLSGRGIGLDVVRSQLQAIQGSVAVYSQLHQGTTFIFQIPLSLTIAKLLLCQAGDRIYALFTDAIEQILIPKAHQIRAWEDGKVLRCGEGADERLIPIYQLSKVLNYFSLPNAWVSQPKHSFVQKEQVMPMIIIRYQDVLVGLEVDQVIGEEELVIRRLGQMIVPPSYIYGGSILADGRLTLVLDGAALMQYVLNQQTNGSSDLQGDNNGVPHYTNATAWLTGDLASSTPRILSSSQEQRQLPVQTRAVLAPAEASENSERQKSSLRSPVSAPTTLGTQMSVPTFDFRVRQDKIVLVVDDSITVRQTLNLTLQKAGYQVLQAKDGYEALEELRHKTGIELVICDIEMPRMNGFEFLKYHQQDTALANIPVVMLTSRSGDKHRTIASKLGATAYITKPYLEHNLLRMVKDVLEKNISPLGN